MKKLIIFIVLAFGLFAQSVVKLQTENLNYTTTFVVNDGINTSKDSVFIYLYVREKSQITIEFYDMSHIKYDSYKIDSILNAGYYRILLSTSIIKHQTIVYSIEAANNKGVITYSKIFKIKNIFVDTLKIKQDSIDLKNYNDKTKYHKIPFGIGVGASINRLPNNNLGILISGTIGDFYFDVSFNGAKGTGKYLEYKSYKTYKDKNEIYFSSINVGYSINISDIFNITPTVGVYTIQNVYNDPIAFDSWFLGDAKSGGNVGCNFMIKNNDFYFFVGFNTFEFGKIGIGFLF